MAIKSLNEEKLLKVQTHIELGEYTKALELIDSMPKTDDKDGQIRYWKARTYIGLDRLEEAEILLKSLVGTYRQDELSLTLAAMYLEQQKWEMAKYWATIASKYKLTQKEAIDMQADIDIHIAEQLDSKDERTLFFNAVKPTISFKDVVGMDNLKKYFKTHIIDAINYKEKFIEIGKSRSLGTILYGAPGTGKTFLVKALAGEAKATFISAHINQLVGSYVGITAKNIASLFLQARMNSPCIIFLDEIDVLGTKRAGGDDAHSNVMKQAVNELLTQLNGLDSDMENIFVCSATNRPWDIDPALKRGKRLGDSIYVPLPKLGERYRMILWHLDKIARRGIEVHVNPHMITNKTRDYTPADLDVIFDEALLNLIHRKEKILYTEDLLNVLKTHKIAIINWFENVKKEFQGEPIIALDKDGNPRIMGYKGGHISAKEMIEYRPLIDDILKYTSKGILAKRGR